MIDAANIGLAGSNGPALGQATGSGGASRPASLGGAPVTVTTNPQTIFQNAAEELTFGAAERMNRKALDERGPSDRAQSRQLDAIQQIERIRAALPDFDDAALARLLNDLRAGAGRGQEALGQALSRFHQDVTYQHAALEHLRTRLDERSDQSLLAEIDRLLIANERALGPEIRAGLNVTVVALGTQAEGLDSAQVLRDAYRATVIHPEHLRGTFKNIFRRYGRGRISQAIEFLLSAVAADLASDASSLEPATLQAVRNDIRQLTVLTSILEGVTASLQRYHARFGLRPPAEGGGEENE